MYHDQPPYHPQNGPNGHLNEHDMQMHHHANGGQAYHHSHAPTQARASHAPTSEERLDNTANTTASEGNGITGDDAPAKKKRKKVSHACLYCRRSHMVCDEGRPCQRCIKRDIGHLCRDEVKPAAGGKQGLGPIDTTGLSNGAPAGPGPSYSSQVSVPQTMPLPSFPFAVPSNIVSPTRVSSSPTSNIGSGVPSSAHPANQPPWHGLPANPQPPQPSAPQQQQTQHQQQQQQHQQQQQQNWGSETLGNEFSVLTEFLESLDDRSFFGAPSNNSAAVPTSLNVNQPLQNQQQHQHSVTLPGPGQQQQLAHTGRGGYPVQQQPTHHQPPEDPHEQAMAAAAAADSALYTLQNSVSRTEQFFMTAADQATGTRDERLAKVIRAKYEAGLLKPYNYVKGYKRLSSWMEKNVSPDSRQAIQQPLAMLRPKFRAVAMNLTDLDLVFIEEAFERLLLDYDRVFSAMGIPACLWRRTGEIYKGNREFASLIGVNVTDLVDGRLAIYELMSEESAVNFWEKYGHVAFDTGQKAVLTSCVLRYKPREARPHPNAPLQERFINCCFSFTIRRDQWGIPVCIVGNFISY
ncbi:hypothetical protein M408DRAFT_332528 [Serendipita vermifera MAFF 305830]|uniref:Zn(2)-C6 fungal-type domain-containing protein n=1 Tax=Serendipita vermifera MAFF 305830 TaxID=933852 RepID=A0A0C2W9F1_SERVB|nr:hypothetical protein M408DRAFT_332528 [Serendipita vermifera MAFF 305830]